MFEYLEAKLRQDSRIRTFRGAAPAEIAAAERALGASFPKDYREFLTRWGYLELDTDNVHGLGPDVDTVTSVLNRTLSMVEWSDEAGRGEWGDDGPEDFYWLSTDLVIYDVGNGDVLYLRSGSPHRGRVPVMCWDHELNERVIAAMSFSEWLDLTLSDPDFVPPLTME